MFWSSNKMHIKIQCTDQVPKLWSRWCSSNTKELIKYRSAKYQIADQVPKCISSNNVLIKYQSAKYKCANHVPKWISSTKLLITYQSDQLTYFEWLILNSVPFSTSLYKHKLKNLQKIGFESRFSTSSASKLLTWLFRERFILTYNFLVSSIFSQSTLEKTLSKTSRHPGKITSI